MKIIAPAKINLYLHLTGRRDDGYHLLDSLFAFTKFGDVISITPADKLSLTIDGQFSNALFFESIEDNLIYRAARMLQKRCDVICGASIRLTKNIPVGSGLGGGSSDAAAVLKGLNQLWNLQLDLKTLCELGLNLGADVPACITHQSAIVRGIGEFIVPIALPFQSSPALLINPNQPLSTRDVFTCYKKAGVPLTVACDTPPPTSSNWKTLLEFLHRSCNDLESSAIQLQPAIQVLLDTLTKLSGCELARMSGSGATCFALFDTVESMQCASLILRETFPTYWIQMTQINW